MPVTAFGRVPPWVRRWGVSITSLALGLATLLVFRRGLPHVAWIVGYLLLLFLLYAFLSEVRAPVESSRRRLVVSAAEYTVQTLYHGLLLFVLPAYWASATLSSANAGFLGGVAGGALVTTVDPWYAALVRRAPVLKDALLGFSIFAALNVALPLVGVRPLWALEMAAALAALGLAPTLRRHRRISWGAALGGAAGLAAAAAMLVWMVRPLVPPAPLFLARAVVARDVVALEPVDEVRGAVPAVTVAAWGQLAAYTAVYAPAGLQQAIEHLWWRDGALLARIPLSPVHGGRAEGFRTWSRRTYPRPPLPGRYTIDVITESGQLIGRLRFTVTP